MVTSYHTVLSTNEGKIDIKYTRGDTGKHNVTVSSFMGPSSSVNLTSVGALEQCHSSDTVSASLVLVISTKLSELIRAGFIVVDEGAWCGVVHDSHAQRMLDVHLSRAVTLLRDTSNAQPPPSHQHHHAWLRFFDDEMPPSPVRTAMGNAEPSPELAVTTAAAVCDQDIGNRHKPFTRRVLGRVVEALRVECPGGLIGRKLPREVDANTARAPEDVLSRALVTFWRVDEGAKKRKRVDSADEGCVKFSAPR